MKRITEWQASKVIVVKWVVDLDMIDSHRPFRDGPPMACDVYMI